MKLKKIASLALAGIMAVSMLAGCKNDGSSNTEEQPNSTVSVSNAATYANDVLSSANKAVFEYKSSTELDAALKAVATDSKKFTSDEIAALVTNYDMSNNSDLSAELEKKLDVDFADFGSGAYFQDVTASKDDTTIAYVVTLPTVMDEKGAVEYLVEKVKSTFINGTYFPSKDTGSSVKYDYTAEISAVKVTAPDDADSSVWVIATVYTRTATESANV